MAKQYPVDAQELHLMGQETREIYAPLAGRLGMSRVESKLRTWPSMLEPDKYAWIRNQIEVESKQWSAYVDRVCDLLRDEMPSWAYAEVSGRVKHLYSFYKKLRRNTGKFRTAGRSNK